MKTRITIIGVGSCGCRILDRLVASRLRKENESSESPVMADIRYISAETNIETLSCTSADVGFYIGGALRAESGSDNFSELSVNVRNALRHVIYDAHLIVILIGLDDPQECAAASEVVELGRLNGIITITLAKMPVNGQVSSFALGSLDRIRENSSALYLFSDEDRTYFGSEGLFPVMSLFIPDENIMGCVKALIKFLYQPNGARVGFDYQDFRTALFGLGGAAENSSSQEFQSTYRYLRWIASRNTSPTEFAETVVANLPLRDAATVMLCFEGGAKFTMSNHRDLVKAVIAKAPGNTFIKYFVDVDPEMPDDALIASVYLRTDHLRL